MLFYSQIWIVAHTDLFPTVTVVYTTNRTTSTVLVVCPLIYAGPEPVLALAHIQQSKMHLCVQAYMYIVGCFVSFKNILKNHQTINSQKMTARKKGSKE